jgi:hypothetical protein
MALFFFHFTNGRTIKDEEGENFPNLEATKAHAAKIAAELATEPESQGFAVSVTDDRSKATGIIDVFDLAPRSIHVPVRRRLF